ncbi:sodium:solute symporter family transporter [Sutterella sp.]|uniref:sodium:solute symporter family transporter n=1 Tax=Sutterella sp. TaxID=1981025 RepID=UPI003FD8D8B3
MPYQVETSTVPFLFVTILYFLLLCGIGWWGNRQNKNLRDFFTMSGSAGAVLSGIAYFSTQYSMSTFMGVPGSIYHVGYAGLSVSVPGIAFSMIIPALIVGRKLIRLGHKYQMLTMADYLADRYESTAIRGFLAVLMLIFLVPMMGAQTIGAGVIFTTYTGAPQWVGIVIMGVTVMLYCMAGGIRSVMITDVIQGVLMCVTAVTTFFVSLSLGGGLEAINAKLAAADPNYMTFPGHNNAYPWQNYASMIVMWSFFTIGQPHLFTKFFTMKNYKTMFKAVILGTLGMWMSAVFIEWCGVTGAVSFPGIEGKESDFIVPLILQGGLPSIVSSLMIAGIFSAGMSTISSLLLTTTSAVSRDLYQRILNRNATDEETMRMSRIVTVVLGILAILIGILKPGSIFSIILFAFGGLGIWAAPIVIGMYWKRTSKVGVYVSMIFGEVLYFLMLTKLPGLSFGFNPLIIAWFATCIVLVVVSLFTTPATAATLERHFGK